MTKRILRAAGAEMRCSGWECAGAAAIIGWGGWLLFALLAFVTGDGDFLRTAPIAAVGLAAFSGCIICAVGFSAGFQLALSLGRTRRLYTLSALPAYLLATVAGMAACYPSAWLSWALLQAAGLARPGEAAGAEQGLLMYHRYWPVLLAAALFMVALGAAIGALMMRFGQKGFWLVWCVCVFGSAAMASIVRVEKGPVSRLVTGLRACANGLSAVGWWGVFALVVAALLAAVWLLVRRAAVR